MCIRDRPDTPHPDDTLPQEPDQTEPRRLEVERDVPADMLTIAFHTGPRPVSYTHLDVYKRQPLYRQRAFSSAALNSSSASAGKDLVSDV